MLGGGGLPHPVMGVPHSVMVGGTPFSHGVGYPIQSWWWWGTLGTLHHPDLALGGTPTPSRPGWGYPPPSRPGWGTPHHPDLAGVPPTIQTWLGYPPRRGVNSQTN